MTQDVAKGLSPADSGPPHAKLELKNLLVFFARFFILSVCVWYVSRQISWSEVGKTATTLDLRWVALSILLLTLQIPMVGLRWANILHSFHSAALPHRPLIAITAVAMFFAQIAPAVVGEGVRLWLLTRIGPAWRVGLSSVVIDRAVAVLVMITLGLLALLMPSALGALGGQRPLVVAVFAAILIAAVVTIIFSKRIGSIARRWPMTSWLVATADAMHESLVVSPRKFPIIGLSATTHLMTILAIWSLSRAVGLELAFADAAVLFTVIVGGALIAISIAGWGVREVLVLMLLQTHGVSAPQAVLFSVSFGLCVLAASLPGLIVWLLYWPAAKRANSEQSILSEHSRESRASDVPKEIIGKLKTAPF